MRNTTLYYAAGLLLVLAAPSMGLACTMVGQPHWFVHHMGLGETIGYGARLTVNNSMLYQSASP